MKLILTAMIALSVIALSVQSYAGENSSKAEFFRQIGPLQNQAEKSQSEIDSTREAVIASTRKMAESLARIDYLESEFEDLPAAVQRETNKVADMSIEVIEAQLAEISKVRLEMCSDALCDSLEKLEISLKNEIEKLKALKNRNSGGVNSHD